LGRFELVPKNFCNIGAEFHRLKQCVEISASSDQRRAVAATPASLSNIFLP
jgi:hypothetical protein